MAYRSCVTLLCLLSLFLEVTDVFTQALSGSRVCIIGAGYSGLAAARYMKEYNLNFTVFESAPAIGGTWRFDRHVGVDESGFPLYTSQYTNLRTNTPRQTMEYLGFPFPEGTPSYPTGTCFYKYLQSFAKNFNLLENIQLKSLVTSVRRVGDAWKLSYIKGDTKENVTESCNFLVVASGEYCSPSVPYFKGQANYKGKIMHSHDYKDAEDFRNQRVLVLGAGASGLDLALQLVNVTSKLVHSHHLSYNQPDLPPHYIKKPDILRFLENGAQFVDDTVEDFDIVIFCTGYDYLHPFLEQHSSGITSTKKYVLPLYHNMINIKYPSMAFIGIGKSVITKTRDAQAQYIAALTAGDFKLPSQSEMLKNWLDHVQYLREKNFKITDVNMIGDDMPQYFDTLSQEAGVSEVPEVLTIIRDFNARNRLEDILNYRDYDYRIIDHKHFERHYNPRKEVNCPIDD